MSTSKHLLDLALEAGKASPNIPEGSIPSLIITLKFYCPRCQRSRLFKAFIYGGSVGKQIKCTHCRVAAISIVHLSTPRK